MGDMYLILLDVQIAIKLKTENITLQNRNIFILDYNKIYKNGFKY